MQVREQLKKVIVLLVVLFVLGGVVNALRLVGRTDDYAPEQPIPFSHKLHAGQYQIPCMYCHSGAEKSHHATVPAMNVCMNCHSVVKPESPHIQKLKKLYNEEKQPFQWVKVHDLPDHVNFSHQRHVSKGVACETCHGDVKTMERIQQVQPMTMGWCLDCHRGITTPEYLLKDPEFQKRAEHRNVAPTQCYTCHK